jgi:4-amino-4-deoxy-L-arabinose transferase-like glycosyltransferase
MLFWEKPWPYRILTIDGQSYIKGAAGATWPTLFKLHDFYHSPGYQIYLRFLFAALGSPEAVIHASKLLSLLMFFASAVLLYRLGRRWFQPAVAQIAVALFLFSESWRYYCNMIQYEVLAGFLMLLFLSMLMSAESSSSPKISRLYGIGMGFVLAFISLIQMRYAVLLLIPLLYSALIRRKSLSIQDLRQNGIILLTSLVLLAVWSFAQSLNQGRTIFLMEGSAFRFQVANNPNAVGYSFPYPDIVEPSGWQFVLSMPGQWLWLIGQRALYLLGIKRDIWALPPEGFRSGPIGSYSLLDLISMIVFATGLILAMVRVRRGELSDELKAGILLLACVMVPALSIFGSKRFIVPVIPLIALFQSYAIVATARGLRDDRRIE